MDMERRTSAHSLPFIFQSDKIHAWTNDGREIGDNICEPALLGNVGCPQGFDFVRRTMKREF